MVEDNTRNIHSDQLHLEMTVERHKMFTLQFLFSREFWGAVHVVSFFQTSFFLFPFFVCLLGKALYIKHHHSFSRIINTVRMVYSVLVSVIFCV